MAHAFLAGHQLEQPVHRPQAHIAGHGAPQRILQAGEQALAVEDQAKPEQRQHQRIRQQLMIDVDHAHRQQAPGQHQEGRRLPAETEMPGDIGRQQAAGEFHQGVALADGRLAGRAFAAKGQVAHQRDVLPGANLMAAMGASGIRQNEIEHRPLGFGRQAQRLAGLLLPVAEHHLRQAMDHHIEEAAHQQAQQEHA
ncbi:hypothetical protein D9M69_562630 [compost metagenome]